MNKKRTPPSCGPLDAPDFAKQSGVGDFHIETFGQEVLEVESPILEAFVAEAGALSLDDPISKYLPADLI